MGSGYQQRPARNQPEPADAEVSQVPLYGSFRSQRAPRREQKWSSHLSHVQCGERFQSNLHTKIRGTQFRCSLSAASSQPVREANACPGYMLVKYIIFKVKDG